MHGPTFMANALACAVSVASVELLLAGDWRTTVPRSRRVCATDWRRPRRCRAWLTSGYSARSASSRWIGPSTCGSRPPAALDHGVWLRPFRNLIYAMPPYICTPEEIGQITSAMVGVARALT